MVARWVWESTASNHVSLLSIVLSRTVGSQVVSDVMMTWGSDVYSESVYGRIDMYGRPDFMLSWIQ